MDFQSKTAPKKRQFSLFFDCSNWFVKNNLYYSLVRWRVIRRANSMINAKKPSTPGRIIISYGKNSFGELKKDPIKTKMLKNIQNSDPINAVISMIILNFDSNKSINLLSRSLTCIISSHLVYHLIKLRCNTFCDKI